MRWVVDGVWLVAAVIATGTLGQQMAIERAAPVLPVIILVRVGLTSGALGGNLFGFACGFLLDLFSLEWFGATMLVDSVVGYLVGLVRHRVVVDSALVRAGVLLVAAEVHSVGLVLVRSVAGPVGPEPFLVALGSGLYSAALGAAWWTGSGFVRQFVGWRGVWDAER